MTQLLQNYGVLAGEQVISSLYRFATFLQGKKVVHVNSTREGGGVAEILRCMIPLMNELGIETHWEVIVGSEAFYTATKSIHNALQGKDLPFTESYHEVYMETNRLNAERLRPLLEEADFVFIHDPQPAPLLSLCPNRKGKWIWRCHIDASVPNRNIWAAFAGYLKARWNVNEIITTLMLNYIVLNMVDYFVYGPWRDPASLGFPMTAPFPNAARLPLLGDTRIHTGLFLAIFLAFFFWALLKWTRWGYEIRVIGENPKAATFAGMNYLRNAVMVMFVSGAIAGLAGMCEIAGLQGRLQHGSSAGYGYTAIIVAWLARLNPLTVLFVAFLIGALFVGGDTLQIVMRLPLSSILVLQGLLLFFVLGGEFFRRYRIRIIWRGDN
jgi:ABC-type uncharacterized transport system permease subunit